MCVCVCVCVCACVCTLVCALCVCAILFSVLTLCTDLYVRTPVGESTMLNMMKGHMEEVGDVLVSYVGGVCVHVCCVCVCHHHVCTQCVRVCVL